MKAKILISGLFLLIVASSGCVGEKVSYEKVSYEDIDIKEIKWESTYSPPVLRYEDGKFFGSLSLNLEAKKENIRICVFDIYDNDKLLTQSGWMRPLCIPLELGDNKLYYKDLYIRNFDGIRKLDICIIRGAVFSPSSKIRENLNKNGICIKKNIENPTISTDITPAHLSFQVIGEEGKRIAYQDDKQQITITNNGNVVSWYSYILHQYCEGKNLQLSVPNEAINFYLKPGESKTFEVYPELNKVGTMPKISWGMYSCKFNIGGIAGDIWKGKYGIKIPFTVEVRFSGVEE